MVSKWTGSGAQFARIGPEVLSNLPSFRPSVILSVCLSRSGLLVSVCPSAPNISLTSLTNLRTLYWHCKLQNPVQLHMIPKTIAHLMIIATLHIIWNDVRETLDILCLTSMNLATSVPMMIDEMQWTVAEYSKRHKKVSVGYTQTVYPEDTIRVK